MIHRCPSCGFAIEIYTPELSKRQREVLLLHTNGYNCKEIVRLLGISYNTVKDVLKTVYALLGVNSPRTRRTGTVPILALNIALRTGQIKLSDLKNRHVKRHDYDY